MNVEIRVLKPGQEDLLNNLAPDLFDKKIDPSLTREFLQDRRHHIAVAIAGSTIVGFASAVHYIHPDKPAELWINEIDVVKEFRRHGLASKLIESLFELGNRLNCDTCWVLTEKTNTAAMKLYQSLGGKEDETVMFSFRLRH